MKSIKNSFAIGALLLSSLLHGGEIRVMSYNVWMVPYQSLAKHLEALLRLMPDFGPLQKLGKNAKKLAKLQTQANERAEKIPLVIVPLADVFAFQEGFDTSGKKILKKNMKKEGVEYSTKVLGRSAWQYAEKFVLGGGKKVLRLTNSGLFTMSKFPITKSGGLFFQDEGIPGYVDDAIADKGALYVRVEKDGRHYHIFNLHTQARTTDQIAIDIRTRQIKALRDFIDEQKIPNTEPVIIVGDMNMDSMNPETRESSYKEYKEMLKILDATDIIPEGTREQQFSAYQDNGKGPGQRIDYVLYSNKHLKPTEARVTVEQQVGILKASEVRARAVQQEGLSDHFPLVGHFIFEGY